MRVWWIPALLAVALAAAVLDQDAGIRAWLGLRRDVAASEARLEALRAEIEARRLEARALESDPVAQERVIREELGWARPGELVLKLPPPQNSSISLTK